MDSTDLAGYYRRRAPHYDRIYEQSVRDRDVTEVRRRLPELFAGLDVLEVAAGTGFWTPSIASTAASVLATDLNAQPLDLARQRDYPRGNVRFALTDAYTLDALRGRFTGAFAGFFWSHVPREDRDRFLAGLCARLEPGAVVALVDNFYVEGQNKPIVRTDAGGNTYQRRELPDGSRYEILKNFATRDELLHDAGRYGTGRRVDFLEFFWLLTFRTARPAPPSPAATAAG